MAYRSDVDALEARLKDLEDQVGDRTRERDEVAALLAEARARETAERYVAEAPHRRQRRRSLAFATLAVLGVIVGVIVALPAGRNRDRDNVEEALAKMREFTVEMCKCRDAACAQKVSDQMVNWSTNTAKKHRDMPKLTDQQMKDATAIGTKMGECMQRAMGAGSQGSE